MVKTVVTVESSSHQSIEKCGNNNDSKLDLNRKKVGFEGPRPNMEIEDLTNKKWWSDYHKVELTAVKWEYF